MPSVNIAYQLTNALDIYRLQTEGLCDRRQRPCKKVSVLGSGFINSTNLTCHIEEVKVGSQMIYANIYLPSLMSEE